MKISAFLLFCCFVNTFAAPTYSQVTKISLSLKDATIEEVLNNIEDVSEFYFLYNNKLIDVTRKVNIEADKEPIKDILNDILSKDTKFIVYDRQIILTPSDVISLSAAMQQQKITGTVTGKDGTPLPGVNVVVTGTTVGTITDIEGKYSIEVPQGSKSLTFSFIGTVPQEISIGTLTQINVTMAESAIGLGEVVVVGYGTAKKENLTGAISSIKTEAILTTTHTSLAQSLQGKIPGLQIRQNSGQPGTFDESINIRGFGSPLYIIDGIARGDGSEFQRINPEDIESISVLKDASAAIFGMNAANGVIIVTTKRGAQGKVKFHINSTIQIMTPTGIVENSNASQYMDIRNDADVNSGKTPYISKDELDKYHAGGPGYENTNWYDLTFKSHAVMQQQNFSAQGGNETVSYFVSFGYQNEGTLLKSNDMFYKKYTFRSNLTTNFTKNLAAQIDISGLFDERRDPGTSFWNIFKATTQTLPTDKVYANNNPAYLGNVYLDMNPLAVSTASTNGYSSYKNKAFQSSVSLTYSVPFVKGLKIKGMVAYDSNFQLDKSVLKSFKTYSYDALTTTYLPKILNAPSTISNSYNDFNNMTLQGHLNYDTKISDIHTIGVTLVYEQRQSFTRLSSLRREYGIFFTNDQINQASTTNQQTSGNETETASKSYLGRLNYNYKSKYLLEFAFRYDGSYRYHPDRRWGFFPVVSGGWRLSEENFIKNNLSFVSNLKIRGSYGLVGEDAGNPFQYLMGFSTTGGGGYEFTNGSYLAGAASPSLTNEKLTWFTSSIKDIGLEFGFFKGKLSGEFDVYQRDREGLLATRVGSLPNTFGASLPQENLNSDRVQGIDFSIGHNNNIGDFRYSIKANFNFARTMNRYVESAPYTSSMGRWKGGSTNRWNDIVWGYTAIGQFQTWDDVLLSPGQRGINSYGTGITELPGDYKYKDVNGDGVINNNDQLPLFWNGTPKLFYGITLSAQWKGFDFNTLFQGSSKYTLRFGENLGLVMTLNGNTPAYFWDRWHLFDPYDPNSSWVAGKYPPSRFLTDVGAMYAESSNWRYYVSYLRLKNLEIGYTFAPAIIKQVGLDNIRVYSNANNLFTICDKFIKPIDPERAEGQSSAGWNYPLTKTFNFGINVTF